MNAILALLLALGAGACAPLQPVPRAPDPADESAPAVALPPSETELARFLRQKHAVVDSSSVVVPWVAVLPFVDESGFQKDIWNVGTEMARLVSLEMGTDPEWRVVPFEVVEEVAGARGARLTPAEAVARAQQMEADLVVQGTVVDLNMGRFQMGDPLLGGYKSYRGTCSLRARALRAADEDTVLGEVAGQREMLDRDVGLDLLGKPRDQDVQFAGLRGVRFGSDAFRQTVLGKATVEAVGDLLQRLAILISPRELRLSGQAPEVLSVSLGEVYINIGSENLVRAGYRFEVVPGPARVRNEGEDPHRVVGVVEVQQVVGARLSSVRVLQGAGSIRAGDRLQLATLSPTPQ